MATIKTATVLIGLCGALALWGCEKAAPTAAPAPPKVTVAQPVLREVVDVDEYTGRLGAVDEVEVRAKVRGYLDSIEFKDGDEVEKGKVLFQIDPRPFDATLKAAEGQLDVVKARRVTAQADVTRYKDLVPKGAATAQDLDRAIGQLGEAEAAIRVAEAQIEQARLDLIYAKITAPVSGVISRSQLSVGNLVGAGGGEELLTTIVSVDPIQVYFDVDQRALLRYRQEAIKRRAGGPEPKTIRDLNIAFEFALAGEQGFPHKGVLDFIDNKVDPTTGTIPVRGEVSNANRLLKPGFFARVRVSPSPPYKAVLVNEQAIGTQQGQKYVFLVDSSNKVIFRTVQLGAVQSDGLRVITSGVAAEDRIILNGMQRARPGATVSPELGEMIPRVSAAVPAATQQVSSGN
jgi:RND family efflux transporter MFP subunit